jgi:glycosyltransferase involved in cell wall biosynthesis
MSKYLQVVSNYDSAIGGPYQVANALSNYFDKNFLDGKIMTIGSKSQRETQANNAVIQLNNNFANKYGFSFKLGNKKNRSLFKNTEIIFLHGFYLYSTLLIVLLVPAKCRIIIFPHGSLNAKQQKKGILRKKIFRLLFRLASSNKSIKFIVGSMQEENDLKKQIGGIPIILTMFGSNVISNIAKNSPAGCNLVTVSRIDPIKNLEFVIALAAYISKLRRDVTLKIIGSGDQKYLAYLKKISAENPSNCVIEFIDHQPLTEIKKLIESADIFLQLSLYENYGIAVAESISCNIPVIVSSKMGISQFIRKSGCGIVVEADDLSEASRAVFNILTEYGTFVTNCRDSKHNFDWDNIFINLMTRI